MSISASLIIVLHGSDGDWNGLRHILPTTRRYDLNFLQLFQRLAAKTMQEEQEQCVGPCDLITAAVIARLPIHS